MQADKLSCKKYFRIRYIIYYLLKKNFMVQTHAQISEYQSYRSYVVLSVGDFPTEIKYTAIASRQSAQNSKVCFLRPQTVTFPFDSLLPPAAGVRRPPLRETAGRCLADAADGAGYTNDLSISR